METSKVTTKYQATIPLKVRKLLGIRQGDMVAYDIENGEVKLRRATPMDLAYSRVVAATLTEWDSKADDADACQQKISAVSGGLSRPFSP